MQLLQGNFPNGVLITLTPWEPGEVWPLLIAGLKRRPAVLSPFVTRPNETVVDRAAQNLAPIEEAVKGFYALRKADPGQKLDGSIILQESGVTIEFISKVLPKLDKEGFNLNVFYVSSSELFELLPEEEKDAIYPSAIAENAFGITGFTLPTMHKWITGYEERRRILHPFFGGTYLGSGTAESVLKQAGLDEKNLYKQIKKYIERFEKVSV